MKTVHVCIASFLTASMLAVADYELGPPETYLASEKLVVVDATIRAITDEGFVEIETH